MRYATITRLETERLILRKITPEDAWDYYSKLGSSPAVTRYMLFQPHGALSDSVASIEKNLRRYETGRNYRWVICLKGTAELIGVIDLLGFRETEDCCSFAYMLAEDVWGKGYGTEAVRAVFDFAFREMDMAKIEADHFADNVASGAVMRKCGMVKTGVLPGKYEKNGVLHDAVQYELTREAWEKLPKP